MFNGEKQNFRIKRDSEGDDNVNKPNAFMPFWGKNRPRLVSILLNISLVLLISAVLFGIAIVWQWNFSLLAICNAFYFSGFMLLSFSLIVYASNNNIFAPLIHGTKTFFLMFAGKKPKLAYYDYIQDNKNHQIPKMLILFPIVASLPNIIVAIILHIIYNVNVYPFL